MEHSRNKTAKAMLLIAAGLLLELPTHLASVWLLIYRLFPYPSPVAGYFNDAFALLSYILLLFGCVFAYRRSRCGSFAVAAVCIVLRFLTVSFIVACASLPILTTPLRNIVSLFETLCFCGALWFLLKGTGAVLRVSNGSSLAEKERLLRILPAAYLFFTALNYVAVTAKFPDPFSAFSAFYLLPFLLFALCIYVFVSARQLLRVKEVDPKEVAAYRERSK